MPSPLTEWKVFDHGPIETLQENLRRVEAVLPGTPMKRVMSLARLRDGRVVVHNGIALKEPEMKAIEAWGAPSILIVPNAMHRLDARVWKDRYPEMKVVTVAGAREKIEAVVKVDATEIDLGDDVRWSVFPGTAEREGILEVRSDGRATIVLTDIVMHNRRIPGFGGWIMKMMGFVGPQPKVVRAAKKALVADGNVVRAHLQSLAARKDVARVVVGHGEVITSPSEGLQAAAASL